MGRAEDRDDRAKNRDKQREAQYETDGEKNMSPKPSDGGKPEDGSTAMPRSSDMELARAIELIKKKGGAVEFGPQQPAAAADRAAAANAKPTERSLGERRADRVRTQSVLGMSGASAAELDAIVNDQRQELAAIADKGDNEDKRPRNNGDGDSRPRLT